MRVNVHCPSCQKAYVVEDTLLGESTKFKQCGTTFRLVAPEQREAVQSGGGTTTANNKTATTAAGPLKRLARFVIRKRLGAGAFGTVYRAFDPQLEREIALKVPQAGVLDSPRRVERFLREAKAAA